MKQYQNLLLFFFCLTVINACKKEGSAEVSTGGGNAGSGKAKTYTETYIESGDTTAYTFNLSYDNGGRLTAMTAANDPGTRFVYTFLSAGKYTVDLYNAGVAVSHGDILLNAKSLADSALSYSIPGDTTTQKFFYDGSDRLVKENTYDYTAAAGSTLSETVTYTYDATGNLVQETSTDGYEVSYEYYTDARYAAPLLIGAANVNTQKTGYLIKKTTLNDNGSVETATHTYTFDDKQRVTSEKAVLDDGSVFIKSYTY